MLPQFAYLLVIIIWATTPLAIKLGGESFAPLAGLSLRIVLAFMVGSVICTLVGYSGLNIRRHWKLYAIASISLFPNMALIYMAATFIPSGLVALLLGLTPFYIAALSKPLLGERSLQPRKMVAIGIALAGLGLFMIDSVSLGSGVFAGVALMLFANLLASISALLVKRINGSLAVSPVEQTLDAMAFSLPGLLICWLVVVGYEPTHPSPTALVSLLYLTLISSLLGYFYILNQFTAESVSLIPLVLAMVLGVMIADEQVTFVMIVGAALIIGALTIHQQPWRFLIKHRLRSTQSGD